MNLATFLEDLEAITPLGEKTSKKADISDFEIVLRNSKKGPKAREKEIIGISIHAGEKKIQVYYGDK